MWGSCGKVCWDAGEMKRSVGSVLGCGRGGVVMVKRVGVWGGVKRGLGEVWGSVLGR